MKKSTLLSFATAAAIVVTSAGTYAAWDKTSDVAVMTNTVTIRKKVSTTITESTPFTTTTNILSADGPVYTTSVPVSVNEIPTDAFNNYKVKVSAYAFDSQEAATTAANNPAGLDTDSTKSTKVTATVADDTNNKLITKKDETFNSTVEVKPIESASNVENSTAYIVVKAEIVEANPAA